MIKIPRINVTSEMRSQAIIESQKRDSYIKHHFEVDHLSSQQRDELGFIGEFACCKFLGLDWRSNIRDNYLNIDDYDILIKNKKIDIKTETVPSVYAKKILRKEIFDDELYGRRLINKSQFNLLKKYDMVIFSLFARENLNLWFPIGYLETDFIIKNYPPTNIRPDGGFYPFPASPVPTSALKSIFNLL